MTHGHHIWHGLRDMMKQLGRKPSDVEGIDWIDHYLANAEVKLKKVRKTAADPRPRARDQIFDVLMKIDGQAGAVTKTAGSRIAGAKKQILEVMPGATTEQVCAEIELRASRYKSKHPQWPLTAMALVGRWAELGGGPKTQAAALDVYQEPQGDWRQVMAVVIGVDRAALDAKAWLDISVDYRASVLKDMLRNQQAS